MDSYIDRWLKSRTELHRRTLRDYGYQLGHIRGTFGVLPVRALAERGRVRAFLAGLRAPTPARPQGYSKDLVRLVRNVGSMLCEDAIEDGLLPRNPFQWRKSRRKHPGQLTPGERTKKVRAMDGAQLDRFLAATREHEPRVYPLFLTMARTGMRPGEALAVRWDDFDGAAKALHICRALSLGEEGPTKTGTDRTIHLSTETVAALKRHRLDVERETLRRGWREVPPWIFCSTAGTPYDRANVVKAMKRAVRKAELPGFPALRSRGTPTRRFSATARYRSPT